MFIHSFSLLLAAVSPYGGRSSPPTAQGVSATTDSKVVAANDVVDADAAAPPPISTGNETASTTGAPDDAPDEIALDDLDDEKPGGALENEVPAGELEQEAPPPPRPRLRPLGEVALLSPHPVNVGAATFVPGDGLYFESADGRFAIATRLRAQFRYTLEHEASESTQQALQIRRARLQFIGHVFSPNIEYKTEFAFSPRDMAFEDAPQRTPILDWYIDFTHLRDLSLRVGQYKIPFNRQRVISSGDLQLVDRSIANAEFTLDRDIGVDIRSNDFLGLEKLRYYAGVYMGEGRDVFEMTGFDLQYLARVELLPFGLFNDYEEADFARTWKPRLSLGLAYAYQDDALRNRGARGDVPADGGTTDIHNVAADAMLKFAGFSAFGEFFWRDGTRDFGEATLVGEDGVERPAPREAARDGLGWMVQAGYLIPRIPVELAARYGQNRRLRTDSGVADADEFGGGISWYMGGHPLKLQVDYFRLWTDGTISDGTDAVRLQLQVAL